MVRAVYDLVLGLVATTSTSARAGVWESARPMQRKTALELWRKCREWAPILVGDPSPVAA